MNVLMVGVDSKCVGGMLTVIENYLNDREFIKKTNMIYIPTVTNSSRIIKALFFIKSLIKIIYYIKLKKIDIIHIHMAEKGSVFREGIIVIVGKMFGCKTMIHMHGAMIEDWYLKQSVCIQNIINRIFENADKILVLGKKWSEFFEKIVRDKAKIQVLYNAVKVPEENRYNNSAKQIIFLGLLLKRKGIDDFLQAAQNIKDKFKTPIKIKLYGIDIEGNINEKIKKFQLDDLVEYCGWLTEEKKEWCFSNTLINVLPSYNEGLPMTILETMSYGIPNITTKIAAIPEAIRNEEDGVLISPGDVEALSCEILKMACNSEMRQKYSENAYRRMKNEFDIKQHIDKLYSIYLNLLKE